MTMGSLCSEYREHALRRRCDRTVSAGESLVRPQKLVGFLDSDGLVSIEIATSNLRIEELGLMERLAQLAKESKRTTITIPLAGERWLAC